MKANERTQFGRAISAERSAEHLTQDQLGQRTGLSAPGVNRAENKLRRVEVSTLRALCTCWPDPAINVRVLVAHLHDEIQRAGHNHEDYEIDHRTTPGAYRTTAQHLADINRERPDIGGHILGLIDKLWIRYRADTSDAPAQLAADPAAPTIAPQVRHTRIDYAGPKKSAPRSALRVPRSKKPA